MPLDRAEWNDSQRNELWFWTTQYKAGNPEQYHRRQYYQDLFKRLFGVWPCPIQPGTVALDVGSGPQGILQALTPPIGRRIACDPLMDEFRRIGYAVDDLGVEAVAVDGEELSAMFGAECADMAFCLNALDHARDPEAVIGEIRRVLKPDGCFFLVVDLRPPELTDCYHKLPLTEEMVRAMLAGFDVDARLEPHGGGNPIIQFVALCRKGAQRCKPYC